MKWKVPVSNEYRRPREVLKAKVRELVLNGVSKVQASFRTGVSLRTVSNWTADIPRNRVAYPQKLRHKMRYLVKKGMSKIEVAEALEIGYTTTIRWTTDIHKNDSKVSGRYFLILKELIEKGYIIAKRREIPIYKLLMKIVPIKSIVIGNKAIYYLDSERYGEAIKNGI